MMFLYFMVIVLVVEIVIFQFEYFKKHKKLIELIARSILGILILAAIVIKICKYGFNSGMQRYSKDYPFYMIVIIIAVIVQGYIRKNNKNSKDIENNEVDINKDE